MGRATGSRCLHRAFLSGSMGPSYLHESHYNQVRPPPTSTKQLQIQSHLQKPNTRAILLLIVANVAVGALIARAHWRIDGVQRQQAAATAKPLLIRAAQTASPGAAAGLSHADELSKQWVEALSFSTAQHQLVIRSVAAQSTGKAAVGEASAQISVVLAGSYPVVKRWLSDTLGKHQVLSLERMSVSRTDAATGMVDLSASFDVVVR